jgi:predicted alpha/beta hydrolase family esterase
LKKNVLFVHCAGLQGPHQGSSDLIAYLQETFGSKFNLFYPAMPDPDQPDCKRWMLHIERELSSLRGEVILVGHSLGGSVLLKYLSEHNCPVAISGLFLLAAPYWGKDSDWKNEDYTLSEHFFDNLPGQMPVFIYHSQEDAIVPSTHASHYAELLDPVTFRLLKGEDHYFTNGLPELVRDIKSLAHKK